MSALSESYAGVNTLPLEVDLEGWNSQDPLFSELILRVRPKVVIEVGVWKGASIVHMATIARNHGIGVQFYAVDVFTGFHDARQEAPLTAIPPKWSTPTRYQQFLFNLSASGFSDRVIPVWALSTVGARNLKSWGVVADMIYIDASHDEYSVAGDVRNYWQLLRPGGVMFGDDFDQEDVRSGVRQGALAIGCSSYLGRGRFWMMEKLQ